MQYASIVRCQHCSERDRYFFGNILVLDYQNLGQEVVFSFDTSYEYNQLENGRYMYDYRNGIITVYYKFYYTQTHVYQAEILKIYVN